MWSWNLPLCKFHPLVLILSIRATQRNSNSSSLLWAGGLEKYAPIRVCESEVHCKGAPRSLSWLGFEKLISPSHWGGCLLPNPGGGVPKSEGRLPGEEKMRPWAAQGAAKISSCDQGMVEVGHMPGQVRSWGVPRHGFQPSSASKPPTDSQQVPAPLGLSFHIYTTILSSPLQSEIPSLKPGAL